MRTAILILAAAIFAGCRDNTPPPPRVPVPAQDRDERARAYERDEMRPLPAPPQGHQEDIQPPFNDTPIVSQRPPEQRAFVESYRTVGSPRITLFVNRALDADPRGAGENYLRQGQYDELDAKSLDYQAIETVMTDWFSANGEVTIISPTMARQRLSDQQVKELQDGRPSAIAEVAQQLDADVLIQVQAHPTKQTSDGLQVRIIAEAVNTKGGQSIGRAVVDVPPPLQKTTINRSTRFLARKLMDDMIQSWNAPPPPGMRQTERPAPPPERATVAPAPAPTRSPGSPVAPVAPEPHPTTVPTTLPH